MSKQNVNFLSWNKSQGMLSNIIPTLICFQALNLSFWKSPLYQVLCYNLRIQKFSLNSRNLSMYIASLYILRHTEDCLIKCMKGICSLDGGEPGGRDKKNFCIHPWSVSYLLKVLAILKFLDYSCQIKFTVPS